MSEPHSDIRLGIGALIIILAFVTAFVVQEFSKPVLDEAEHVAEAEVQTEALRNIGLSEAVADGIEIPEEVMEPNAVAAEIVYLTENSDQLAERVGVLKEKHRRTRQRVESRRQAIAEALAPEKAQSASSYTPSDGVMDGMQPWYDTSYRTTRERLQYVRVDADEVRVGPNVGCVVRVEYMFDRLRGVRHVRTDEIYIGTSGRYRGRPAGTDLSDMHRATRLQWLRCD